MTTKHIFHCPFLLFFVAWIVTSCSSAPRDDDKLGAKLTFVVSDNSRASTISSFTKFAVYGDAVSNEDNSANPLVIFNNTEVELKNGSWVYDNPQYWLADYEHSFVAVSPTSALDGKANPQYIGSKLSFTYSLPESNDNLIVDDQIKDIVVATHRRLYNSTITDSQVILRFSHILSQINIYPAFEDNVLNDDDYLEVRKIEMNGFNTQSNFDILPANLQTNNQTDDRVINATRQSGNGKLIIGFPTPVKITNHAGYVRLFDANNAIIMIPQAFVEDSDAKIILTYTTNQNPKEQKVIIPLANQKWETGKSHGYRFSIDRSGVRIDATTITEWDVRDAGNINVY